MTKLKATGTASYQTPQKDQTVRVGRKGAQVTTAARIDMIGTVWEVRGDRVVVRVFGWMADGYHMDVAVGLDELCFVKVVR